MKQLTNTKWMLSALLITALGSQYYYSVSSKDMLQTIDFSSRAIATTTSVEQGILDATNILTAATSGTTTVTGTAQPVVDRPTTTTEGTNTATCTDCVILTRAEAEVIRQALTRIADAPAVATTAVDPDETPAERLRRERQERADARIEAEELKREQELEALEARNEEFTTKMEEAAERCDRMGSGKLSCITSRYSSLLRRYSRRNNIDPRVARAAYAEHIEPALRSNLNNPEGSDEAAESLSSLMNIPNEYRQVRESATMTVRRSAEARATSIRTTLTEAKNASDQKDYVQSQQLLTEANQQYVSLRTDLYGSQQEGREGILDVLSASRESDSATWAFVQSNLISPVRSLFSDINTHNNRLFNAGLGTDSTPDQRTDNGRGSRGGDNSTPNSGVDLTRGLPTTGQNTGVGFGSPTQNMTGTRQPRN